MSLLRKSKTQRIEHKIRSKKSLLAWIIAGTAAMTAAYKAIPSLKSSPKAHGMIDRAMTRTPSFARSRRPMADSVAG